MTNIYIVSIINVILYFQYKEIGACTRILMTVDPSTNAAMVCHTGQHLAFYEYLIFYSISSSAVNLMFANCLSSMGKFNPPP